MKNILHIAVSFDHPDLVEHMVEELASRRYHHNTPVMVLNKDWETIETSTTDAFVNGTIAMNEDEYQPINSPFTSQFLFTCSKVAGDSYTVNWAMSLN